MFLVISYDITDDRRRDRVHQELKNYGTWVQYSVFECELTWEQTRVVQSRIGELINPRTDSVRYYYLCQSCIVKCEAQGREKEKG
jgi:CRISPR-associated protein Cas2